MGWPHADSPFHAGEQAVQQRAGSRERMAEIGWHVIRGAMPDQHRGFFPLLSFVALGTVDAEGQPHATLLAGPDTGFISAPGETELRVGTLPPADDPLAALLRPGAPLGLLGIELATRRRNRANGFVVRRDAGGFTVQVQQSFGNCPKYIQRRVALPNAVAGEPAPFIATHAAGNAANAGSDVSHRGGRPGFLRIGDDGRTLTWPDFSGNRFFNTLGNIEAEPRVGLVIPDFANGDLLHLTGRAEIVWDGPELATFAGAERLVRLHVESALHRPAALPLRWRLVEPSPALP
jgi:hypothetical protein